MTDETVRRHVLPNVPKIKSTPFVAHARKELIYTPELLKAVAARNTYRKMSIRAIALDLDLDTGQISRAIGLGRKLLVKEYWADMKPALQYTVVTDGPAPPKKAPKAKKTEFKWPLSLVKWALAQAQFNGHGATALSRAIPATEFGEVPTKAALHLWISRSLRHVENVVVTREDCAIYPWKIDRIVAAGRPPTPGVKVKAAADGRPGRKPGISLKAQAWAIEKACELIIRYDITDEELS